VQAAAAPAGRRLVGLALAGPARVRVLGLDAICRPRAPVWMALAPHRMAWRAGQRGPERRGERGRAVLPHGPCREHGIADGGQGLARGGKRAPTARGAQGAAAETVSRPAMTMGLDVVHTHRARARVFQRPWQHAERQRAMARQADTQVARDQRQGREPRGVSGGAGRAWRQAERLCAQAGNAHEAVPQSPAALAWCEAQGRLACRPTAQAHLAEARPQRHGACGSTVQRLRREERTLRHGDRWWAPRTAAVSAPVWRDACPRLWSMHDQIRQAQGDACGR
jgi:hypothetical protein